MKVIFQKHATIALEANWFTKRIFPTRDHICAIANAFNFVHLASNRFRLFAATHAARIRETKNYWGWNFWLFRGCVFVSRPPFFFHCYKSSRRRYKKLAHPVLALNILRALIFFSRLNNIPSYPPPKLSVRACVIFSPPPLYLSPFHASPNRTWQLSNTHTTRCVMKVREAASSRQEQFNFRRFYSYTREEFPGPIRKGVNVFASDKKKTPRLNCFRPVLFCFVKYVRETAVTGTEEGTKRDLFSIARTND